MPAKKNKHQNTFWAWFIRVFSGPETFKVIWNDKLNTTDLHKNWLSNVKFNLSLYNNQIKNSSRYTTANRFEYLDALNQAIELAQREGNARVAYPTLLFISEQLKKKQVKETSALYAILQFAITKYQLTGLDKKPAASSVSPSHSVLPQLEASNKQVIAAPKQEELKKLPQEVAAESSQQERLSQLQQQVDDLIAANKKLQQGLKANEEQQLKQAQAASPPSANNDLPVQQQDHNLTSVALAPQTVKPSLGTKQPSRKQLQKEKSDISKLNNTLTRLNNELSDKLQLAEKTKEELAGTNSVNKLLIAQLTNEVKQLNEEIEQQKAKFSKEKQELTAKAASLEKAQQELIALIAQTDKIGQNKDIQVNLPASPQAIALAFMDKAHKERKLAEDKLIELQNAHESYRRDAEAQLSAHKEQAQKEIEALVKQKEFELAAQAELAEARAKLLMDKNRAYEAKIQNLSRFIHRLWVWFWSADKPRQGQGTSLNLSTEQHQELQSLNDELVKYDIHELTVPGSSTSDAEKDLRSNENSYSSRFSMWFSSSR